MKRDANTSDISTIYDDNFTVSLDTSIWHGVAMSVRMDFVMYVFSIHVILQL
jgi:hypothetical protein